MEHQNELKTNEILFIFGLIVSDRFFFVFLACLNIKSNLHSWKKNWNLKSISTSIDRLIRNELNFGFENEKFSKFGTKKNRQFTCRSSSYSSTIIIINWIWQKTCLRRHRYVYTMNLNLSKFIICHLHICHLLLLLLLRKNNRKTRKFHHQILLQVLRCRNQIVFFISFYYYFSRKFLVNYEMTWKMFFLFCFVLSFSNEIFKKNNAKKNPCCYTFDPLIPWNEIDWKLLPMIMMPMQWTSRYFFSTELNSIHHHQHDHHEYEENHSMHTGQPPKSI